MLIHTTKGELDEAGLKKQTGEKDDKVEKTSWVEYWLGGDPRCEHVFDMHAPVVGDGSHPCLKCSASLVHRSVAMQLKKPAVWAEGIAGKITP